MLTEESSEVLFANQEEKPLVDEALASFDVDVSQQADLSQWDADGGALTPCRKVTLCFFICFVLLVIAVLIQIHIQA